MKFLLSAIASASLMGTAAHANVIGYTAAMNGANENPAAATTATGFVTVTIDDILNTLRIQLSYSGLVAAASAAHIHCCIAAPGNTVVAVPFTAFPAATSGTYDHTFDLLNAATYNGAYLTAHGGTAASAEADLLAGIASGNTYVNIHDSVFPGGEIRGFPSLAASTPEPATILLSAAGILGFLLRRRLTSLS
jgi:hypothetical protein